MIVVIDNYDSFTYNLVQMMAALAADIKVFRNDDITVQEIAELRPAGLVISPGPGIPQEAGISVEAVQRFSGTIPLLGVCLGHQGIAVALGGTISSASRIMHGKTSLITHDGGPLYDNVKSPFQGGRYHSLAIVKDSLPPDLVVDATSDDGEIMGMHHRTHQTWGVQFHPESVLTPLGKRILRNFLTIVGNGD
jgi:anthranilate synthase/aminodeoxychorismate synthase-like glutamine amidotransferase